MKGRASRARKYAAAFSIQLYLALAFLAMAITSATDYYSGARDLGVRFPYLWPWLFLATAILCAASVARPFSERVGAAAGTAVALIGLGRSVAILDAWPSATAIQWIGLALWGLVVVVGLRWPLIAYEAGVKHLLDVSRERARRLEDHPPGTVRG